MSVFQPKPPPMFPGGAAQMSTIAANSPWLGPAGPGPGQMNTQQRLDAHYGNMVKGFDANPHVAPQRQQSSAQLQGVVPQGPSPWTGPAAPAQDQGGGGGGGGGFFSTVASLFAGLF